MIEERRHAKGLRRVASGFDDTPVRWYFCGMNVTMPILLLLWLYAALLAFYVLCSRSTRAHPWWIKILSPIALWLFAPIVLLIPLGLLLGTGVLALIGLVGTAFYASRFRGTLYRGARPVQGDGARRIKVMTGNLFKGNRRVGEIVRAIRFEEPDIVALQELRADHASALDHELADLYPYRSLHPGTDSEGMGLLSRHPVRSFELCATSGTANKLQRAAVEVDGRTLWVINMHPRIPIVTGPHLGEFMLPLGLDDSERVADLERIADLMDGERFDAILLGDMNATPECQPYGLIASEWRNAFDVAGRGLGMTYPVHQCFFGLKLPLPIFRIDHIFYRGAWRPVSARNGRMPGSDHRYVVAEFVPIERPASGQ